MIEALSTSEIADSLLRVQKEPPIITPSNLFLDNKSFCPWLRQMAVRNARDAHTRKNEAKLSWEGWLVGLSGAELMEGINLINNDIGGIILAGIMRYPYKYKIAMEELLVTGLLPEGKTRATQAALLLDLVLSSTLARVRAGARAKLGTLGLRANPDAQNLQEQLTMVNRLGRGEIISNEEGGQKELLEFPPVYIRDLSSILNASPWVQYAGSRPKEGAVFSNSHQLMAVLPMAGYPGMRLFARANSKNMPSLYELYSSQYDFCHSS